MPTAVISATVTGTLDQADRRAMLFVIGIDNARRAALDPPEAPWPVGTNLEIRDSYRAIQSSLLNAAHLDYVRQSDVATLADIRALWESADDAKRNAARAALQ
jgi:hypothetical protein